MMPNKTRFILAGLAVAGVLSLAACGGGSSGGDGGAPPAPAPPPPDPQVRVTGSSPFAAGCGGGAPSVTLYPGAEV